MQHPHEGYGVGGGGGGVWGEEGVRVEAINLSGRMGKHVAGLWNRKPGSRVAIPNMGLQTYPIHITQYPAQMVQS